MWDFIEYVVAGITDLIAYVDLIRIVVVTPKVLFLVSCFIKSI